ncbi:uncharacterized protein LOC110860973 [Folsomia candida]|uniref:uncharacterized protein LOC110860973 n=1 Tax=Folsomia candida TaxID=158441 RepID=UPI000B9032B6|nr:uncharacterized protein LOC110860973 [Folsomia candida]
MGKIALLLLVVFLANCASGSEPHFKGRMARTATISPNFSEKRMRNLGGYKSGGKNSLLYATRVQGSMIVGSYYGDDGSVWSQVEPSGYPYKGYFHFVNKLTGYCLQAGSSTGYGVVENEDRAVIMPCDGGEPTQIFSNADYYGVGTEQFKDLSSGKCLTMEVDTSEVYMYDCGYYNDNQWWDMFRGW